MEQNKDTISPRKLTAVIGTIFTTVFLLAVMACSVTFAYFFDVDKSASVTITMHPGITMTVAGITGDVDKTWTYKNDNVGNFGTTGSPLTQLDLSPIAVTVNSGASAESPCYVRMFVAISAEEGATLANDVSFGTNLLVATKNNTETSTLSYTSSEQTLINSLTNAKFGVAVFSFNSVNVQQTLINTYQAFNSTTNTSFEGKTVSALVVISASSSNNFDWDNAETYSFSLTPP